MPTKVEEYLNQLSDKETQAMNIAYKILGDTFNIEKV